MDAPTGTPEYMRFDGGMYFVKDGWVTISGSEMGTSVDRLAADGFIECPGCRMTRGALQSEEVVYLLEQDRGGPGWALSRVHDDLYFCRLCGIAEGVVTKGIDFAMARRAVASAYEQGRRLEPGLPMYPYTGIPLFAVGDLYSAWKEKYA